MSPDPSIHTTSSVGQPSWMAPVIPTIPDHELVRRIGGGSYGDVWLARTAVGTWRAVKVVFRDRFIDPTPYEREFRGMLAFEPLSRGNEAFVDLLQVGRNDADGYFYYVMELADGVDAGTGKGVGQEGEGPLVAPSAATSGVSSLPVSPATYVPKTLSKVLLQRGRLPVDECLELGLTLNLGLAHLHRAGLIHRDIKPSNMMCFTLLRQSSVLDLPFLLSDPFRLQTGRNNLSVFHPLCEERYRGSRIYRGADHLVAIPKQEGLFVEFRRGHLIPRQIDNLVDSHEVRFQAAANSVKRMLRVQE